MMILMSELKYAIYVTTAVGNNIWHALHDKRVSPSN